LWLNFGLFAVMFGVCDFAKKKKKEIIRVKLIVGLIKESCDVINSTWLRLKIISNENGD